MAEKLEGSKTFEVPVQGGFNKNIESHPVAADSTAISATLCH